MVIDFAHNDELNKNMEHHDHREQRRRTMIELAEDNHQHSIHNGGPRIAVVGVGGGGSNAVDSMGDGTLESVEFIVVNTDVRSSARTQRRIHIGKASPRVWEPARIRCWRAGRHEDRTRYGRN